MTAFFAALCVVCEGLINPKTQKANCLIPDKIILYNLFIYYFCQFSKPRNYCGCSLIVKKNTTFTKVIITFVICQLLGWPYGRQIKECIFCIHNVTAHLNYVKIIFIISSRAELSCIIKVFPVSSSMCVIPCTNVIPAATTWLFYTARNRYKA